MSEMRAGTVCTVDDEPPEGKENGVVFRDHEGRQVDESPKGAGCDAEKHADQHEALPINGSTGNKDFREGLRSLMVRPSCVVEKASEGYQKNGRAQSALFSTVRALVREELFVEFFEPVGEEGHRRCIEVAAVVVENR